MSIKKTLADVRQALQDLGFTDSQSWERPQDAVRALGQTLAERERALLDLRAQVKATERLLADLSGHYRDDLH